MLEEKIVRNLIINAFKAREKSYSPFSGFSVGAALLTKENDVFLGTNVECSGYSSTCCAERVAIFKAVSVGERDFKAIAIVGGFKDNNELNFCAPCGVCLQVLNEFCDPLTFDIILAKSENEYEVLKLIDLLPRGFKENS